MKIDSSFKLRGDLGPLLTSAAACAVLGVKPATLYAYVSRRQIRAVAVAGARERWYVADDVHRIATRAAARRGHAAVAAGALRWGEPVLESAITSIEGGRLAYRGQPVAALIAGGARFETVAELLWAASPGPWSARPERRAGRDRQPPVARMIAALPTLAYRDPAPWMTVAAREHERARTLCYQLATAAGARFVRGSTLAAALARAHRTEAVAALDAILVAVADHELNASTFAARVAAGAGADLYAAVGAALYTFTGRRHGAAAATVAAFLDELPRRGLRAALRAHLGRGRELPGFGHPLYPDGDPRFDLVVERLPRASDRRRAARLAHARAVTELGRELTGQRASFDYALVMATDAFAVAPHWASAWFALGRCAGWIAHALEQRATGAALRPRARYVGPAIVAG